MTFVDVVAEKAKAYVKTLPGINYKSLYDFGTQNIAAYTKGYMDYHEQDLWINVEDALPEMRYGVLAWIEEQDTQVCAHMDKENVWLNSYTYEEIKNVTKWQHLPENPKKR